MRAAASTGDAGPAAAPAPSSNGPAPDGRAFAPRDAPIGGQAVLEGVMMRGTRTWAVAVRKPADDGQAPGEIELVSEPFSSWVKRSRILRVPFVRGVVALVESLVIGFRALGISANVQAREAEGEEIGKGAWTGTVVVAIAFAVGLFFLLPGLVTSTFKGSLPNGFVFLVIEKAIRISIFLAYLWLIARMRDLQRVFEYHGAEHKAISCYEAGEPLTPESAQRFSRLHPRCGTSFLLIVMIVAIFVFAPFGRPAWWLLITTRVLGIPVVAGIAFEAIKLLGRHRTRRWARILMAPGLQLQKLTTREPALDQLAVAIAALEAVLAVEDPLAASEEEKVGMEVVA